MQDQSRCKICKQLHCSLQVPASLNWLLLSVSPAGKLLFILINLSALSFNQRLEISCEMS